MRAPVGCGIIFDGFAAKTMDRQIPTWQPVRMARGRASVTDFLADGRLLEVLPHLAMPALPAYALHAFGRQLPIRGRLFINFMIEKLSGLDL